MKTISALLLAILIQICLSSMSFASEKIIFSMHYWVDERGVASFSEAQQAKFSDAEGSIALGYSAHALWIKLTIVGQPSHEDLAVVVRPAFLRQVELYDPAMNGANTPPVLSGRDAAIEKGNHVGLDNGFVIPASPKTRDIYLRIITTTSLTADVTVLPADEATHNSLMLGGLVAVYFAALLGICLWSVVAWALRRDPLYGLFAFRQLYSLAHLFVFFGSLRLFLSETFGPEGKELIYAVVSCTVATVAGYFDVRLISEFGGSRRLRGAIYFLLCAPVVTLTFIALGQVQTALQITAMSVNLQMFALVAYALSVRVDSTKPYAKTSVLLLRFGYVIMAAVVVVPLLMYQNLLHTSVPMFKILFLHAVVSTIILFAILSIRSRQLDLMAQEARLLLELKEAELLQESSRRMEKERFLSMLTHELRNPLSVIELLPGTDPASVTTVRKAARDMAEVIDRVEQSERIDSGLVQVEKVAFDLSLLVRQAIENHSARDRLVIECAGPAMVVSDVGLLHRIVGNLLDNAAKYSKLGTEIRIALEPRSSDNREGVELSVANEIGKAGPPDPDRLFTKYYRAKGAHRQPGSGLGLFLVASWVAALGGTINYRQEDQPNGAQLARFTVWVPT